jgi:hypothetical protein
MMKILNQKMLAAQGFKNEACRQRKALDCKGRQEKAAEDAKKGWP